LPRGERWGSSLPPPDTRGRGEGKYQPCPRPSTPTGSSTRRRSVTQRPRPTFCNPPRTFWVPETTNYRRDGAAKRRREGAAARGSAGTDPKPRRLCRDGPEAARFQQRSGCGDRAGADAREGSSGGGRWAGAAAGFASAPGREAELSHGAPGKRPGALSSATAGVSPARLHYRALTACVRHPYRQGNEIVKGKRNLLLQGRTQTRSSREMRSYWGESTSGLSSSREMRSYWGESSAGLPSSREMGSYWGESSSGLPSSREMRSYWRESSTGLRG